MGKLDTLRSLREGSSAKKAVEVPEKMAEKAKKEAKIAPAKALPNKTPVKKTEPPKKRGPKPRSGVTRTRNTITTDGAVWEAFMKKYRGQVSVIVEEWMRQDLGGKWIRGN